jgi:regulator of protease activity HflC (stomatin/prohibitin superfamily)
MLIYIIGLGVFVAVLFKWWGVKPFVLVRAGTVVLLERNQQFYKELRPGLHPILPFYDCARRVAWQHRTTVRGRDVMARYESDAIEMTEQLFELPFAEFYTKDEAPVGLQVTVSFVIVDARAAVYSVPDLHRLMETELTSRLCAVIERLTRAQLAKPLIEKHMKSENGAKVWEQYGVQITTCRVLDLELPQPNTDTRGEPTPQADEEEHDACRLRRRRVEQEQEMAHLRSYVELIRGSGLPPEFFIQYMEKQALHKLVARHDHQGDNRLTTIYVPHGLNALPSPHHTDGAGTSATTAI